MKIILAILLLHALAIAQSPNEADLRQALAVWSPVEPKPPEYLEALGSLGVIVEGRLIKTPNQLGIELEPLLDDTIHKIMSPGFPGDGLDGLIAARVLDVYGILLQ